MKKFEVDGLIKDIWASNPCEEEKRRLKVIATHRAKDEVFEYILDLVKNLIIEVVDKDALPASKLIGNLVGWCWQTTESMGVFFPDSTYVIRGNMFFSKYDIYYHSWLCFTYKQKQYVFDPCFNYLCSKRIFDETFEVEELAKVPVKKIKDCMLYTLKNSVKQEITIGSETTKKIMQQLFGDFEISDTGIAMPYSRDDVNAPFYRNNSHYKIETEDDKIKSLRVHYYYYG